MNCRRKQRGMRVKIWAGLIRSAHIKLRIMEKEEKEMRLEEMILVTENWKGTETIFLLGLPDYMQMVISACVDSAYDMADAVKQLYDSQKDMKYCSELYFAANKSSQARFCISPEQLRGFLLNMQDGEAVSGKPVFDESRCTPECLEVLKAYGIGKDGHSLFNSLHYEQEEHNFHVGETVRNLNGTDYRVLDILSKENLLLMNVRSGEILVGVGTKYYQRTPKEGYASPDSMICGIEWGHGAYLGNRIADIVFEDVRSRYGTAKEEETLAQYRNRIKYEYRLYQSLAECMDVSHAIRNAAWKSLDDKFGTEDYDTFLAFLQKGYYDGNFQGIKEERNQMEKGKSR